MTTSDDDITDPELSPNCTLLSYRRDDPATGPDWCPDRAKLQSALLETLARYSIPAWSPYCRVLKGSPRPDRADWVVHTPAWVYALVHLLPCGTMGIPAASTLARTLEKWPTAHLEATYRLGGEKALRKCLVPKPKTRKRARDATGR